MFKQHAMFHPSNSCSYCVVIRRSCYHTPNGYIRELFLLPRTDSYNLGYHQWQDLTQMQALALLKFSQKSAQIKSLTHLKWWWAMNSYCSAVGDTWFVDWVAHTLSSVGYPVAKKPLSIPKKGTISPGVVWRSDRNKSLFFDTGSSESVQTRYMQQTQSEYLESLSLSVFLSLYHFVSFLLSFLFLLSNKIFTQRQTIISKRSALC